MDAPRYYLLAGACLLVAVALPALLRRYAVSPAMVLVLVGVVLGTTPLADGLTVDVEDDVALLVVQHVTELAVLTALMGVGLALDRPLDLLRPRTWRRWSPTWRLVGVAMPLTILGVALLGWALGLPLATALLLGAVLSPTDPVLASDVQVGGPGSGIAEEVTDAGDDGGAPRPYAEDPTEVSESGEVRFALTSEAGVNDGLAFPFVHAAVLVVAGGPLLTGVVEWAARDLVLRIAVGVVVGVLWGRFLGAVAFRARAAPLRLAEQGEPLLALAAMAAAYGTAELLHGYGFLAVFACAMGLRAAEHRHDYHRDMHDVVQRLERLLTLLVLLLLGISFTSGLLEGLDWRGVAVGVVLVVVVRPATAWISLAVGPRRDPLAGGLGQRARLAVAFFGIRGIGSIYYLAWALGETDFEEASWLWATVGFTVALSVVLHGAAATPVMRRLDDTPASRRPS